MYKATSGTSSRATDGDLDTLCFVTMCGYKKFEFDGLKLCICHISA